MKIVNTREGAIGACNNKNKDHHIHSPTTVSTTPITFANHVLKTQMRLLIKSFTRHRVHVKLQDL